MSCILFSTDIKPKFHKVARVTPEVPQVRWSNTEWDYSNVAKEESSSDGDITIREETSSTYSSFKSSHSSLIQPDDKS